MTLAGIGLAAALALSPPTEIFSPFAPTSTGDREAFSLLPARFVAHGPATGVTWSADGRYLLMLRVQTESVPLRASAEGSIEAVNGMSKSFSVWDSVTGELHDVFRIPLDDFGQIMLTADPNVVMLQSGVDNVLAPDLHRLELDTKRVSEMVFETDPRTFYLTYVSPTIGALALVYRWPPDFANDVEGEPGAYADIYDLNASKLHTVQLHEGGWLVGEWAWSADGRQGLAQLYYGRERRYVSVDLGSGQTSTFAPPVPSWEPPAPDYGWSVVYRMDDEAGRLRSVMFAADGQDVEPIEVAQQDRHIASPIGTHLALSGQNGVRVHRVVRWPLELVLAVDAEARREAAISEAKQAALAMLMYENDLESFPLADQFPDEVLPYVRTTTVLEGFVYLLDGQRGTDFDDPSRTVLGYKRAPGGFAVAFVDGSARWLTDVELSALLNDR